MLISTLKSHKLRTKEPRAAAGSDLWLIDSAQIGQVNKSSSTFFSLQNWNDGIQLFMYRLK